MKRTNMIFRLFAAFCTVMLMVAPLQVGAVSTGMNWYCVHAKDHKQPRAGSEFDFLKQYDGYYIDAAHGDGNADKVVYLTFDAGYENGNVEKILNVLRDKQVPGAFFILGNLIERNPDLVKRMADEGHLVCNHTYHHRDMTKLSPESFEKELRLLEEAYQTLTGKEMARYYRPPEGKFSEDNLKTAQKMGYRTILWSFGYPDWDNHKQPDAEAAKAKILDNIHNGAVILLHPTSDTNAKILGNVIDTLKTQGYRFGTLDELTTA